jgi:hypothetical protein
MSNTAGDAAIEKADQSMYKVKRARKGVCIERTERAE